MAKTETRRYGASEIDLGRITLKVSVTDNSNVQVMVRDGDGTHSFETLVDPMDIINFREFLEGAIKLIKSRG